MKYYLKMWIHSVKDLNKGISLINEEKSDKATYLKMVQHVGYKIISQNWHKNPPKFGESYHLFVMIEKSQ